MANAIISNLTMTGLNTTIPRVFWGGVEVLGITEITVVNRINKEATIGLKLKGTNDALYMELIAAGIQIKKGK